MEGRFFGGAGAWLWGVVAVALSVLAPASSRAIDPLRVGGLPVT
jgi:hypothetical protein